MNPDIDVFVKNQPRKSVLLKFILSVLLPLALGLGLFVFLLRPPLADFTLMLALMSITALISMLAAFLAYRAGWVYRSPGIRWTLMAGYLLAGILVFLNIYIAARMMFANDHDLQLATVLLVFATGIALSVGYFLSEAITDRIVELGKAARQIARGDLSTRVEARGRDEMSALADTFNEMAVQLQTVEQKKQELDTLKRDLVAWASHDLRTPLTSIRAILEALGDGVVEDPVTVQRYLQTARRDVRALTALIDDLFEVSQMDAGGLKLDIQTGSLSDLISDTIESFSELARRQQVQLQGEVQPGVDPVRMDTSRIGRVLANLVGNAMNHTPAGGSIKITARLLDGKPCVSIQDSGEGIKPTDLPHIFERFYRGDLARSRVSGNAGLGLAIARGIIDAHGGKIWAESPANQGAAFHFTLPAKN